MLLIIGVARDITSSSLIDGLAQSFVYLPLQQAAEHRAPGLTIAARARGVQRLADEIRTLVASMDARLPIVASQTLEESVALGLVPQRVVASVSASLGGVGLLLAAIGIYGVTAFAVTRRLREFGIRIALGARPRDIVRLVLRQGLALTALGCAIGLSLGAVIGRLLTGYLFGIPPLDPLAFGSAALLFAAIGLLACYGPARRAIAVDPLTSLRHD